jgi:hypothetical protein
MAKLTLPGSAFKEFIDGEILIDPGWHSFRITKVEQKISSKGDSMNYFVHFECTEEKYKARKGLKTNFNEKSFEPDKARYQLIPFILALDDTLDAKSLAKDGISLDWDSLAGKELKARVGHKEWNGRISEEFLGYMPMSANV